MISATSPLHQELLDLGEVALTALFLCNCTSMCDSVKWDTWELATLNRSRTCGWLQSVDVSKLGLFLKFGMPGLTFQPLKHPRGINIIVPLPKRKKSCFWLRGLCGVPAGAKGFTLLHSFQGQEKPLQGRAMVRCANKCLWFTLAQTSNSVFLQQNSYL